MNAIEHYANHLTNLTVDEALFAIGGKEICPAEGTRSLRDFAAGLPAWYRYVDRINVKKIIMKNWLSEGKQQVQGVIILDLYYKVNHGEAKVDVVQVLHADSNNQIVYLNSFWDINQFNALAKKHPELKQIFDQGENYHG